MLLYRATGEAQPLFRGGRFGRSPYQRSPDRRKSKLRRQMLAATSPMPPKMMAELTPCQQAYARLVADEYVRTGDCRLPLDQIAARCGMCSKTAQRAQQRLKRMGWIDVEHRPRDGRKHDTNIISVTSPEWLTWIAMGKIPKHLGGQRCLATANMIFIKRAIRDLERLRNAPNVPAETDEALAAALRKLETTVKRE